MSYRVLIIEENAAIREAVSAAIGSFEGVEVISVRSGFDALKLLPRHRFDLIITDVDIPDIDGFELVNFVKKSPPHRRTPLLMIGETRREDDRARGFSLGATDWVEKPFTPVHLEAVVRRHLSSGEVPAVTA